MQAWEAPYFLPAEIGQLTNLRELLVLNMALTEVPPWLTHLQISYSSLLAGVDYDELQSRFPKLRICLHGGK